MTKIFVYSLIFTYCFAEEIKHSVAKGDTLWDISGKYLKDNFRWKEIYEANKDKIKNPDLIYPGQEFRIVISTPITKIEPDVTVSTPVAQVETKVVVSTPPIVQPVKKVEKKIKPIQPVTVPPSTEVPKETVTEDVATGPFEKEIKIKPTKTTFIVPFDWGWEPDGYIIGAQEKKKFLNINDVVYIDVGKNKNLTPNMKCYIYRATVMRELGGVQMKFVGILRVTDQIGEDLSTAVIINVQEPIRIEDPILILYE